MKTSVLFSLCMVISALSVKAQGVTQLNNNNSLEVTIPLAPGKIIVVSDIDSSIWVTDGTAAAGTIQLSPDIKHEEPGFVLGGKYVFIGSTPATGSEIYITDGTPAGTLLVKDIFPGATGSAPDDGPAILGGFIYFTAETPAEGRELWRTDGTPAGTTLVKDIVPGAAGSNEPDNYHLFSNGTYLLFAAQNAALGIELWKSDGTTAGTIPLLDINPGADSSNPEEFFPYNSMVLFLATTAANGEEIWKTDGTPGGTELLKDINPGADSSNAHQFLPYNGILLFLATTAANGEEIWKTDGTSGGTVLLKDINPGADSSNARGFLPYNGIILFLATEPVNGDELWKTDGTTGGTVLVKDINPGTGNSTTVDFIPGFPFPLWQGFYLFNNRLYFRATGDGTSTGEVWGTDGTTGGTTLLKDIVPGATALSFPTISLSTFSAVNLTSKFIFPVSDGISTAELWESDGTPAGTQLFTAFTPNDDMLRVPFILVNFSFDFTTGAFTNPLFQGDKFFFVAGTDDDGYELWVSDGTLPGTIMLEINPGTGDGFELSAFSYLHTTTELFFAGNDGANGNELWKSDGTIAGTTMVDDINSGPGDSELRLSAIYFGKIIFTATDGDDVDQRDLFVIDGTFQALPVTLSNFTVRLKDKDALLQWSTLQEVNSKDFTIQRSFDGRKFENVGVVQALGTSSSKHDYSYIDAGIANSGKTMVYYSLLAADKDGKSKNSNVISLKLKGHSEWNVRLLSNPVRDNVNVMLSGITENVHLLIMDLNGKTFYKNSLQNVNGLINVPANNLQSGIYILVAESKNERKVIRFVK